MAAKADKVLIFLDTVDRADTRCLKKDMGLEVPVVISAVILLVVLVGIVLLVAITEAIPLVVLVDTLPLEVILGVIHPVDLEDIHPEDLEDSVDIHLEDLADSEGILLEDLEDSEGIHQEDLVDSEGILLAAKDLILVDTDNHSEVTVVTHTCKLFMI